MPPALSSFLRRCGRRARGAGACAGGWLAATAGVSAPGFVPEALPDPHFPGCNFPESEATLTRWISEMTRGLAPEVRAAAGAKVFLHGWGLWAALTAETGQMYEGQRLRVFET